MAKVLLAAAARTLPSVSWGSGGVNGVLRPCFCAAREAQVSLRRQCVAPRTWRSPSASAAAVVVNVANSDAMGPVDGRGVEQRWVRHAVTRFEFVATKCGSALNCVALHQENARDVY